MAPESQGANPASSGAASSGQPPSGPGKDRLLHLLAEAAELEHNLLCSYLFALFSLKQTEAEDLTGAEFRAVEQWRSELTGVCVEEMTHLAQIANLTVALGSRPHFNRPNIPVPPGYHPASVVVELTRFDQDTLTHFAFLERPADEAMHDGESFAVAEPFVRVPHHGGLMASGPNYQTIGEFYEVIKQQLAAYAGQHGEAALISGPTDVQLRPHELHTDALRVVDGLEAALAAIDEIVKEGEGAPGAADDSHFAMFQRMRARHGELSAARPGFAACRDVARNPVMHAPVTDGRMHIVAQDASRAVDAANAAYGLMLRLLGRSFETPWAKPDLRKHLLDGSVAAMQVVSELGKALTLLDAADQPGVKAGISFAMQRAVQGELRDQDALAAYTERARQIEQAVRRLAVPRPVVDRVCSLLTKWISAAEAGRQPADPSRRDNAVAAAG